MSKRREVEDHIAVLDDIRAIMESMKNLAMMEAHKLTQYHATQQRAVDSILKALNSVRRHYAPQALPAPAQPLYLLLGSERGFCGAYNEQLLETLSRRPDAGQAPLIGVGTRLAGPLQREYPDAVCLPGAAVADEAAAALAGVIQAFNRLQQTHGPLRLEVIHFQPDSQRPACQPAVPALAPATDYGLPPLINLPPPQLLGELLEQYLFALTHAWFFAALLAENQQRVQHLDQAGHHLARQLEALGRRRNVLRQEEIIEEIEVILLSSEAVGAAAVL